MSMGKGAGKSTSNSMPIDASMAMRLHEAGGQEDQERMAYVLSACLDGKERWLARGLKRPQDLRRWALAGTERWGLAEEFEPMRRLARSEAWVALAAGARGRLNEVVRSRVAHLAALGGVSPRIDHFYWLLVFGALGYGAWAGVAFGEWAGQGRGAWAPPLAWLATAALLAVCLRSAVYVWQDSSSAIGEGIKVAVWGHAPEEEAAAGMAWMERQGGDGKPGALSGADTALFRKARKGSLSGLEALELARAARRAKAWREDWPATQERLAESGREAIERSSQPGWALARMEQLELEAATRAEGGRAKGRGGRL